MALVPTPATTGGVPAHVRPASVSGARLASGLGESFSNSRPQTCGLATGRAPLDPPFSTLGVHVTPAWAVGRYMPAYYKQRSRWADDYDAVLGDLVHTLVPQASLGGPRTGPEHELLRRLDLATCVLFNQDGIPRRHPPNPPYPRPRVDNYAQPWLRALVTGWV